jgi:tyrosinase
VAAVRRDIVGDTAVRDAYVRGVKLLKAEFLGPTTRDVGLAGDPVPISTYDLFVIWHHFAMDRFTPVSQRDRNAAHRGPVFLPWHRSMLLLLELQLQRVLGDTEFGLPYWDWAADGELSPAQQLEAPLWADDCMGGDGDPVASGPFAFSASGGEDAWRVRIEADVNGRLRSTDRGLRRARGTSVESLPSKAQVAAALRMDVYDEPPWGTTSPHFRNCLEGWRPLEEAPGLHNRVHVWVGGDMLPSSSPNDPVFFLNHCNVDRIWAAWQQEHPQSMYLPDGTVAEELLGHRVDDEMDALFSPPLTPRQMLEVGDFYAYDSLTVA